MKQQNSETSYDFEIAIIGAGFAGIGAGIRLATQNDHSFVIFERASSVGGTWRDNTYPGCACDIPSFLYSYSFEPNPDWSRNFSRQPEIWEYLKHCTEKYKLTSKIRFNTAITGIRFDEQAGLWEINDNQGNLTRARVVISGAGPLNEPFYPKLANRSSFEGTSWHSMNWNHDFNLKGKRVAVIGTGASAIQFVPQIASQVDQLYVFQRTPPWIAPKPDEQITDQTKERFRKYPWYQRMWREFIYWFLEYRGRSQYSQNSMRKKRTREAIDHLNNSVKDPELRKKLTPDYELGCKRVLISEDYYPAIQQPNVALITGGVSGLTPGGVVAQDGSVYEVDAIIYGTGFQTTQFSHMYDIQGMQGRNLIEEFNNKGGEAYYGVAVSGFPNFFFLVGPNSGLGHNSIIHIIESQLNYVLDYLKYLRKTATKAEYFDLKAEQQSSFNKRIQKELANMVWNTGGCNSYYLKDRNGKNTSIWPGSTVAFRKQTKKIDINNYRLISPK